VRDKRDLFHRLLNEVKESARGPGPREAKLLAVCQMLRDEVRHYHWVGFYLVGESKEDLILGPYVGEPTRHRKISFGQGVCGMAAEKRQTLMVPDVSKVLNYLSCSPRVQSEIVVPIFKDAEMVAQLDIDSHALNPFTEEDRAFLEDVGRLVAKLF
jgi:L-methionine (R)-S-oxide reductase